MSSKEWHEVRIKDICTRIVSGGTPSRKKPEYYINGIYPWVKTQELKDCNLYETEEQITDDALNNSSAKICPINTVSMAMYGATVGKLGILKKECATNQACCNMSVDTEKADFRYLYYYLLHHRNAIINLANGAAQQNLNVGIISDYLIKCPSLVQQNAIAYTLSCLDDMIELNNRTNKVLEEMAQAIFKQWFIDFEFPNENGEPYKSSGGEIVNSQLGITPRGWTINKIDDLCQRISSGGTPSTKITSYYEGNINWFTTKELKDNYLFSSEKKISESALINSSAKLYPANTILMAIYAAPTVGRLGILTQESTFNQAAVGLVSKDPICCTEFLYLSLLYQRSNLNNLANGAAQQNLNVGIVKKYPIMCPTIKEMMMFKNVMTPLFKQIKFNSLEILYLQQIRDTLLPKLMSGEIDVSDIDF